MGKIFFSLLRSKIRTQQRFLAPVDSSLARQELLFGFTDGHLGHGEAQ